MEEVIIYYFCERKPYIPMQETFLAEELDALGFKPSIIPVLQLDNIDKIAKAANANKNCKAVVFWMERMLACSRTFDVCLDLAKKINKSKYLGGFYATIFYKQILEKEQCFDYVIQGLHLPHIAQAIKTGHGQRLIQAQGDIDINKYSLNLDYIAEKDKFSKTMDGYYASQICPNNCRYCANTLRKKFGLSYQTRSLDKVKSDILQMKEKFKCEEIALKDPVFFANPEAYKILQFIKEQKIEIAKNVDLTLNEITEDRLRVLSGEYNVRSFFFGLEAFSQEVLIDKLGKYSTIKALYEISEWVGKYDVRLSGIVMFGFPWQTKESIISDARQAIDLMKKCPNIRIRFLEYIPIPGTEICEEFFKDKISHLDYRDHIRLFDTNFKRRFPYQKQFHDFDLYLFSRSFVNYLRYRDFARRGRLRKLRRIIKSMMIPAYEHAIMHHFPFELKALNIATNCINGFSGVMQSVFPKSVAK
jgi:radical SAM superfamily enzyme YgiQ (UPF0313 family)